MARALDDFDINNKPKYAGGHYNDSVYNGIYKVNEI